MLAEHDNIKRNTRVFAYDYTRSDDFPNGSIHLTSNTFRHEILAVLKKKGLDIIKQIPVHKRSSNNAENGVTSLAFDTLYVLDDKKNNPLNAPGRFDYTSDRLIDSDEFKYQQDVLDYDACVKLIRLAENSKSAANDGDELAGL